MENTQIAKKPCLLFIHGYGSSKNSRKFRNLKDYFKNQFDYAYMEWNPNSDFSKSLKKATKIIKKYQQIVLVGDSTGANFAYQLRELNIKRKSQREIILVLTSPLLDLDNRLGEARNLFIENLKNAIWKIEYPENCLIIASKKDDVVDQTWLFGKRFEGLQLIEVNDHHKMLEFEKYVWIIEKYIEFKIKINKNNALEDWWQHRIDIGSETTGIDDVILFVGPPDFILGHLVKVSNIIDPLQDALKEKDCFVLSLSKLEIVAGERNTELITDEKLEKIKEFLKLNTELIIKYYSEYSDTWEFLKALKKVNE